MSPTKELYSQLNSIYSDYEEQLKKIDKRLDKLGRTRSSIVVKTIRGNKYYYEQWREGKEIKCINLGRLSPGAVADKENENLERDELLKQREELERLKLIIEKQLNELRKKLINEETILEDYTFEVFWKDELSARVSAKGKRVHVSRYIIHPVRQLFYSDNITRNQLNEILKLRCFDEGRPDIKDILKAWGLSEYRPIDMVRKTHGVTYNDYIWFRFPGEKLTAKDVLVRDEYVRV